MPTTKNALVRYQTLDRCFRNPGKRFYFEDLLEECNRALNELGQGGIGRTQLYKDIRFMKAHKDWDIEIEKHKDGARVYYQYADQASSINNNSQLNQVEAEKLKSALSILNRFKGLPQFKWINELIPKIDQAFNLNEEKPGIISFDNNEFLKGLEFIDPLFNAILYKKCIEVKYQSFRNPEEVSKILSPYHLKEYNNRWYVYGKDMEYSSIINLALDRISSINESSYDYIETTIDFEEYFEDSLGVSINSDVETEKILLRVEKSQWPYIETKPLHGSQRVIERDKDYTDIQLELIPNYELESQILQFGEKVEVLRPITLRKKIKNRVSALWIKYE